MQQYTEISIGTCIPDSRSILLDNDKTAISNSSGESAPLNPLMGQTWYDSTKKELKIYDNEWNNVNTVYFPGSGLTINGTTFNHASSVVADTIGLNNTTSGDTLSIPYATVNSSGHITDYGVRTHTVTGFLTSHQDISGKADKATTLAGYGVTDAYTKTEVDKVVANKVAEVVANAPEDFNTLKEISDYIASDKTQAANIISDISTLKSSKAPAYQYSTSDLTAGSSYLATGTMYLVYE